MEGFDQLKCCYQGIQEYQELAINCLYPLEIPICGKETNNKFLETFSEQEQEVNDETVTGEKA